ncbi:sigma-54 dependent transcriptional regulator [Bacteroides sp. 519]|uniref:sigma-54-dependent transcriptional regulator n=1 Tax=Bacteroides sp. 519 TaxID=2302937 RepID=UPI0013D0195F|nr:sigma-54 dependent transcriptional regulator [Bacteroides sp. 519]NDV58431.1 sigma-54-dependent Fis family transcriptional regulator [Bacteroides sp. 519]
MNPEILIIEDDISFGEVLKRWAEKNGFNVSLTTTIKQAKEIIRKKEIELILTDLRLPDGDGIMFLSWLREIKNPNPVIIMTSYAEIQSAVAAIKLGAFDYLEKPVNPEILKQKINQALNKKPEPVQVVKQDTDSYKKTVYANSRQAKQMYEEIEVVAPTRMSILIMGESGTGKEYAARMIHEKSKRYEASFIAVDCGILSRELAPSELFGHVKGAFTSAISNKKGVFEQADGGTVFLDEIENLPYEVQVQLLRALQELRVRPVGSATDIKVDVRIIVATNENLEKSISEGRFREDLYHRLNEFTVHIPPLRERLEDIPVYASHFLEDANKELEKNVFTISDEAMEMLINYHWSGNLRELRNVIRRATLFAKNGEITPQVLPDYLCTLKCDTDIELKPGDEKEQILTVLRIVKGNKAAAARLLKMSRKGFYNKLHQYGIELR